MATVPASREFSSLYDVNTDSIVSDLNAMAESLIREDRTAYNAHLQNFSSRLIATMGVADLMGRRRVRLEVEAMQASRAIRQVSVVEVEDANPLIVPRVDFEEAIADIVSRVPQLGFNAEEVAAIYRKDRGFALVGAQANQFVTKKVQNAIIDSVKMGIPRKEATRITREVLGDDWSPAYADMVVRTNLNTAYGAGRLRQAQSRDVRAVAPGFRYDATMDRSLRRGRKEDGGENHAALNGMLAATDDPIWDTYYPPGGYGCRCVAALALRREFEDAGMTKNGVIRRVIVPAGASFHPNFRSRPDAKIYSNVF